MIICSYECYAMLMALDQPELICTCHISENDRSFNNVGMRKQRGMFCVRIGKLTPSWSEIRFFLILLVFSYYFTVDNIEVYITPIAVETAVNLSFNALKSPAQVSHWSLSLRDNVEMVASSTKNCSFCWASKSTRCAIANWLWSCSASSSVSHLVPSFNAVYFLPASKVKYFL